MPIIIEWTYADGSKEVNRIGANVWRKNENKVVKTFMKTKPVVSIKLDPFRETADIDERNNNWPAVETTNRFKLFKQKTEKSANNRNRAGGRNPMQRAL